MVSLYLCPPSSLIGRVPRAGLWRSNRRTTFEDPDAFDVSNAQDFNFSLAFSWVSGIGYIVDDDLNMDLKIVMICLIIHLGEGNQTLWKVDFDFQKLRIGLTFHTEVIIIYTLKIYTLKIYTLKFLIYTDFSVKGRTNTQHLKLGVPVAIVTPVAHDGIKLGTGMF